MSRLLLHIDNPYSTIDNRPDWALRHYDGPVCGATSQSLVHRRDLPTAAIAAIDKRPTETSEIAGAQWDPSTLVRLWPGSQLRTVLHVTRKWIGNLPSTPAGIACIGRRRLTFLYGVIRTECQAP